MRDRGNYTAANFLYVKPGNWLDEKKKFVHNIVKAIFSVICNTMIWLLKIKLLFVLLGVLYIWEKLEGFVICYTWKMAS